jgi:hypothetical protein
MVVVLVLGILLPIKASVVGLSACVELSLVLYCRLLTVDTTRQQVLERLFLLSGRGCWQQPDFRAVYVSSSVAASVLCECMESWLGGVLVCDGICFRHALLEAVLFLTHPFVAAGCPNTQCNTGLGSGKQGSWVSMIQGPLLPPHLLLPYLLQLPQVLATKQASKLLLSCGWTCCTRCPPAGCCRGRCWQGHLQLQAAVGKLLVLTRAGGGCDR